MNSLRYFISKRTPHNFDDLVDYLVDKNKTPSVSVSLRVKNNGADAPITGTEFSFSIDYTFTEKDRKFTISEYAWESNTSDISVDSSKYAIRGYNPKKMSGGIELFKKWGIAWMFATPELESIFNNNVLK